MMDDRLIEKRLGWIEASCEKLRRSAKPASIETDEVQRGFAEHTLQTAIQAAIDVATLIVTARKLGEPDSTRSLFRLLALDGWVSQEQVEVWRRIVGFRNIVVRRYLEVDPAIVRGILETSLVEFGDFVRSIRSRMARPSH
jgi:uncharacterized protein YutE (UPF0331/DUF86 family)